MEKQKTRPRKKPKTIQDELLNFGKALKAWDGDVAKIMNEPFKSLLKSSVSTYKDTQDPCYLLLSFVLQSITSYVLSKTVMSKFFFKTKTEYEFPKKTINELGDKVIDLAGNVNQTPFLPKLLSLFAFAYQNDLLPTLSVQ